MTNYMLFKDKVLPIDNVLPSSWEEAKKLLKMLVLSTYHIMHAKMIVFYIEENMHTKRYVRNVGMTGMINQKIKVNHVVLLLRY